jgi:hypothetical protein
MKNFFVVLLIAPILGFGQYPNGLVINDIFAVNLNNHTSLETALVVPENKVWAIISFYSDAEYTGSGFRADFYVDHTGFTNSQVDLFLNPAYSLDESKPFYLFPQGTAIYDKMGSGDSYLLQVFLIYEFSFGNNSLSYNEAETIKNNTNTPVLFPNPTSSLLALNSDKEYDIEVLDMAGNKVMALTGNTIDMSHLSSATYIVKALNKVENEEVSYKVVKN